MRATDAIKVIRARRMAADGTAREIRTRAGLTQAEVASVCGVTVGAVSLWESGERRPSGEAALRYARLLERLVEETTGAAR